MTSRPGRRGAALLLACTAAIIGCTPSPPAKDTPATTASTAGTPKPGSPGAGDGYYPADGNGGYDATGYRVAVSYHPGDNRLDGDTVVSATATQDLSRFNLDLRGFDVSAVEVDGTAADFRREGDFELVVTPERALPAGAEFTVRVRYSGEPTSASAGQLGANGWQRSTAGGAFVLGQPHSAAFWYPVNEHPRDKATFDLEVRVPDGWTAVSIGREVGTSSADGWTTTRWQESNPVASYLTTVAIGRFSIDRSQLPDGTPVLNAYAPGAHGAREIGDQVDEVVAFLTDRFGPYPQTTAGGIYLADTLGFSLETQGRPTYAGWANVETVVHEMAHQWFGNSVSVRSWSDICLNECLASYAQWLWAEEREGADLDERYRQAVGRLSGDDDFWSAKLYDMGAGNEFDGVYDKGILAIHALRRLIGEEAFARVLRDWPARHRDGNASWPEFERFVGEVSGQDLRAFFDAWFRGDAIPAEQFRYPGSLR
jgi:aminopeptidase N